MNSFGDAALFRSSVFDLETPDVTECLGGSGRCLTCNDYRQLPHSRYRRHPLSSFNGYKLEGELIRLQLSCYTHVLVKDVVAAAVSSVLGLGSNVKRHTSRSQHGLCDTSVYS
jgi:hypothetical protein